MKIYFQMRKELASEGLDFLFKTPVNNDDGNLIIYEGEVDEEEYISWKPIEMNVSQGYKRLEDEFEVNLNKSIIDYFNSYWFADLDGFFKEHYIKLEPVLPNDEISSFRESLRGYINKHGDSLVKIPIGIEGNGLLVVVDNDSGIVQLEDFERGTFEYIAENIQDLIRLFTCLSNVLFLFYLLVKKGYLVF
ncbi:SecY-interacting protein Syd [Psychrobacillus psychrodurans]|uniref:SecY-interacting protein Syd n=1 Tax=Psychrobacillus psychrodurans TaxID=126157 RepID=UPI000B80460D|nr:SecY-interacting protein Syd [Psychrobacillus psychrodurans]MCZ8540192.1 SecY-interacting protein Syd [Psychrobacillus psychrodurans]